MKQKLFTLINNISFYIKKLLPATYKNRYQLFAFSKLTFWNRFFIIILTAIIWLCFLSIFSANILDRILNPISFATSKSLIVEIYPTANKQQQKNRVELATNYLNKNKYVKSYRQVPKKEIIKLINDFTGDFKARNLDLNVPSVLVVNLTESSDDIINEIRDSLSQTIKDIYVDTEKELIQRLATPINAAKYFAIIVPIIAVMLLFGILFLITSSIVFANKRIIKVLILLGIQTNDLAIDFGKWIFEKSLYTLIFVYSLVIVSIIIAYLLNIHVALLATKNYILANLAFIIAFPLLSSYIGMRFVKNIIEKSIQD